jgi:hypothetical protein
VFGGCFDDEFRPQSERFFQLVRKGRVVLLISQVVENELALAPTHVRQLRAPLPKANVRGVEITNEVRRLSDAYLAARVLGSRSIDDATHVAAASVSRASAIVSCNFKHIVSIDRVRGYNRVNQELGYEPVTILTPQSVLPDAEAWPEAREQEEIEEGIRLRRDEAPHPGEDLRADQGLHPRGGTGVLAKGRRAGTVGELVEADPQTEATGGGKTLGSHASAQIGLTPRRCCARVRERDV